MTFKRFARLFYQAKVSHQEIADFVGYTRESITLIFLGNELPGKVRRHRLKKKFKTLLTKARGEERMKWGIYAKVKKGIKRQHIKGWKYYKPTKAEIEAKRNMRRPIAKRYSEKLKIRKINPPESHVNRW